MSSAVLPQPAPSRSTTIPRPLVPSSGDLPVPELVPEPVIVYITGLSGIGIEVKNPFYVQIDRDEDGFIAKSPISLVYEMGETWQEALQYYVPALVEHFEWLTETEQSLSRSVRGELALLREYLWLKK